MSLSQADRIARNQNRILYAEYLTKMTEYNNGTRAAPPSFKGDTGLFLQTKVGRLSTTLAEETATVITATPAPAAPSSSTLRSTASRTSITLSFPVSANATGYSFVLNGVPTKPDVDNSLSGSVTFSGLLPGTSYPLVVTTTGSSGATTSALTTIYTLPIAPPSSSFQHIPSPGGVTVGWAGGAGATSYTYTVRDASGKVVTGYSVEDNGASGYAVLTGLPAGQQFTITVNSTNPSGTVSSLPFSVTTAPTIPTTPPVPSSSTQTSFSINTPSIPGALTYTYTINGNPVTPTVVGGVVTFSGLTPGKAQNLVITAVGPNSTQTSSAPFSIYTAPVPLDPTTFTMMALNSNDITIRWPSNTNSGTTSYTYILRDLSGNPVPGAIVIDNGLTNSSATIMDLPAGGQYTLTVVSQNSSGSSSSTPFLIHSPPAPTASTESSFSIPTPSVSGAVNYIYRINDSVVAAAPAVPGFSVSGGEVTFTGLPPGVAQKLVVTSVNASNVQTSTPALTVYTAPVSIPASSFSSNTSSQTGISLNWPAGSGATSYRYSITDLNGNPIPNVVISDDGVIFNSATISGLSPGTSYLVTVTPENPSGAAIPTTFRASTAPPTPPQPTVSSPSQTGFSIPVPSLTGATEYMYSINGVQVYPNVVNGVATFSGLTPGVEQSLVITAMGPNNVQSTSPPYVVYTTPVTLPTTNFNTSDSTSTELRVQWAGYTGATSYIYSVKDASGRDIPGAVVTDNGVASNSIAVSGLAPGTQYTVSITPINPSGFGAPMVLTAYTAPPAPSPPVASSPTTTGFKIPPPSVPGATSYVYTVNNIQYTPTTDSSGNLVFTGLPPGVPQSLVVTAVGENNTQAPSPAVTVYTTPVTLPSSAFNTSTSTPTTLNIQWTGLTGATSYIYEVKDASGNDIPGSVVTDNGVGSNSATVSGLAPGTAYTVRVTARNPSGDSTPIVINASTAPPTPPQPVPSAPTQTGFTIPAPSVSGASSYIYTVNGLAVTPTVSGGNLVFTGLTPGVPQVLVVTAVASNNARSSSAALTIYTEPVPLVAGSVTKQATPTSVTVSWPPNSTGATVYEYAVLDASGVEIPGITVVDNGVGFNSATVVGLAPGTVYSLRVTAKNPAGTALPTLIPINTAPRIPALPTASAPTTNGFTINAPSSPGALSYKYTINDTVIAPAPATPGYTVSGGNVVFTGLTPGVPQKLVVTALGPNNSETPCAAITVYTLPVTLPSSAFTTPTATSTSVTMKWTGLTGATSYIYEVKDVNGNDIPGAVVTDNGLASNSIVVSGLAPGTAYTVKVTARNPSGDSTPTTITTYTSPATPPQPLPSAPTQTGFTIPAPSVSGANSYVYHVNGVAVTPTVSGGNLVFTGLTPGVPQVLVLTAVGPNNIEVPSTPLTVYTTPVPVSSGSVTSQPSSNGGTFRWPTGTGATVYEYSVVDASGTPIPGASVLDNGISSNSATVVGVPPGTAYRLLVTARNPSGTTAPTSVTATTAPARPSPPIPTAPTENGFSISAPSAAGALSYIYTINGLPVTPTVANGIVTFSGLTAGIPQRLIVTAIGPSNLRESSVPIEALTKPVSLPSSAFSTPSASPNGVNIRWSGRTGATSYTYSVRETNTNPVTGFTVIDNGVSSNFAMITGLAPGKEYTISVTARNASGDSTPTTFTTYTAPAAQALSRALAATTTGFTISPPSAAGALSYIYIVNDVIVTPTVSGDTLVFTGLTPGVIQNLVIKSVGLNNLQTSSVAFPIYTKPVSIPLSAFVTIGSSPSGFTIQWSTSTGATAYSYTITDGSGAVVPTATITDNGILSKSVAFGGLSVGIGYRVIVTSTNSADSTASAVFIGYTGPSPPYSFSVSNASQTAFTLSWLGGIGASFYKYQLNGNDATPAQDNGMSNKNAVFTGRDVGETYIVKVIPNDNYGSSSTGTYVVITVPSTPTGLTQTAATQTGFTFTWTGGKGALSYIYSLNGNIRTPSIDNGVLGKTATFSGLEPGTNYFPVVITAKNDSGQMASAGYNKYTLTAAPTNLATSVITSKGFTLSWTAPTGADSYTFILNGVERLPSTSTSTSATFNSLSPGTPYTVIVNADNPAPGVTPSNPITITTTVAPSQPAIDSSSVPDPDITSAGIKIVLPTVTGGTAPISFIYSVLDGSGNSRNVVSTVSNGIATLTGLLHSTVYTVSITAVDAVGTTSLPSTPYAFATLLGPQKPISLTNAPPTLSTITVSWSLGEIGTVPVQYTYTLNNLLKSGSSSTSSPTTFSGLGMDTPYSIIVNAVDQYGSITASDAISAKTLFSLPLLPTSLAFPSANVGNTTALLTWSGGDYATSFNIVVTSLTTGTIVTPSISTFLTNGNLAVNSAQISGLLAGFSYSVTVQGVNTFGNSSVSSAATVTTTVLVTTFASGLVGPTAITTDGTNLYVAQAPSNFSQDTADNIIRIDPAGNKTVIVTGVARATVYNAGKTAITTQGGVFGITYVPSRSPPLIFADVGNRVIKACETDGTNVTTILGSGTSGTTNGIGTAATFTGPYACVSDSNGNLYISDSQIRKADLTNLTTNIGAGGGKSSVAIDTLYSNIWYTVPSHGLIYNMTLNPPIGFKNYFNGGSTRFSQSSQTSLGITNDVYGNVIVADTSNNRIRVIYNYERSITYNGVTLTAPPLVYPTAADTANSVIIYAGSGASGSVNDTLLNSTFDSPCAVQLSADNTILYVTDSGSGKIRAMPYVIYTIISSLPPVTPTSVVQKSALPYQFAIGWSGGVAATSYTYLIKDSLDTTVYPGIATLVSDSVTSKTASFSGLTYGQTYTVTVTATNVNGSVSSAATAVAFNPLTNLFDSGLTSPLGITVDSSNNLYVITTTKLTTYPSGVKTTISLSVTLGTSTRFVYSSARNSLLINSTAGATYTVSPSGTVSAILVNSSFIGAFSGIDRLGRLYVYVFSNPVGAVAFVNIYTISNTLIGKLSTLQNFTNGTDASGNSFTSILYNSSTSSSFTNIMTVDLQGNVYIVGTYNGPVIRKFSPNGTILYTYNDTTNITNCVSMFFDNYGNLIFICLDNIYILNLSTASIMYNGSNYGYESVITYCSRVTSGIFIPSQIPSARNGQFMRGVLDTTGSILYIIDSLNNIITIPYLISKLPPTPIVDPVIISGTPSTLTIEWRGGMAATSYSYTFTDLSGNPVAISIPTDNGVIEQKIIISGNFPVSYVFNLGITATNDYGNRTISSPITVTGFVSTFSTGLLTPAAIAFDPNNLLYVTQAVVPSATIPNMMSIASDGVTKTTIVSTHARSPSGLAYNSTLGLLMMTDTGNGILYTSALTSGVPVSRATSIVGVRGCVVDSYGNTYVVNNTLSTILKFTPTYVKTTHITQPAGSLSIPSGITIDPFGNLWVADTGSNSIKQFTNSGTLLNTYTGFRYPRGITSDKFGNIIVADTSNNVIKIIYTYPTTQTLAGVTYTAVTSGLCNIYTYAGTGISGSANIQLLTSSFNIPWGVQLDNTGTVLYVCDSGNGTIRSMPYNLSTLAPVLRAPSKPLNLSHSFISPSYIKISWNNVFYQTSYSYTITDSSTNPISFTTIRDNAMTEQNITFYINPTYSSYNFTITATNGDLSTSSDVYTVTFPSGVTTFAGSGTLGNTNGIGVEASFSGPSGCCIDPATGDIYVSCRDYHIIRKITPSGVVSTFAGNGTTSGICNTPKGITIYDGYLYCCNSLNLTKISLADGSFSLVINNNTSVSAMTQGQISLFDGVAIVSDGAGNFYVSMYSAIFLINSSGTLSLYAYLTGAINMNGIALDSSGNLYVSQARAGVAAGIISKIDTAKNITNVITGITIQNNLLPLSLQFSSDYSVLYIASSGDNKITKYTIATATLSTVAGSTFGYLDSSTLTSAKFANPSGFILHPSETFIYVIDTINNRIRMVKL